MWNPNTYRDTDYGLPDDEPFEPGELDGEFVPGKGEAYIQTVLGPIRPEEAEVALVHEHLQWSPGELGNPQAMLTDLEAFFTASGRTIVSSATAETGRDAGVLLTLAQHVPVHIVASVGWCGEACDVSVLADTLAREIDGGLDGTPVRPGMIVADLRVPDGGSGDHLAVLVEAQQRSGLPATVLADHAKTVDRVLGAGFTGGNLIVGGDAVRDLEVARSVAEAGAFVLVSSLEGVNADGDRQAATLVATLAGHGYGDRVLLSHGFKRPAQLNGYGGAPGLAYIVEQFAVMLMESGLAAPDVRLMLVDNASRALSVRRVGTGA